MGSEYANLSKFASCIPPNAENHSDPTSLIDVFLFQFSKETVVLEQISFYLSETMVVIVVHGKEYV